MFPAVVRDEAQLKRKDYVFGIRDFGVSKAWPLDLFAEQRVINDRLGDRNVVLVGDAATRTVRAFDRGEQLFEPSDTDAKLFTKDGEWMVSESALIGPAGARLARIPGHISYWFAWDSYVGIEGELSGN